MATINTNGSRDKRQKGKPTKANLRVDFTPMVDMNMLLITFFMFCTTFAKPQIMDLVMPSKIDATSETPESVTTTVILGEGKKIYYFFGKSSSENEVYETDYSSSGIRKVFLERNTSAIQQIKALSAQKYRKEITEDDFKQATDKIKSSKDAQVVIIKPSDKSSYSDLVNILDEVRLCNISKYAVTDLDTEDIELIKNKESVAPLAHLKN
jgi:biopolymer transport protein ExbD